MESSKRTQTWRDHVFWYLVFFALLFVVVPWIFDRTINGVSALQELGGAAAGLVAMRLWKKLMR